MAPRRKPKPVPDLVEVTAAVNLPRFPRGTEALVDRNDPRIRGYIRGGYLVPVSDDATATHRGDA